MFFALHVRCHCGRDHAAQAQTQELLAAELLAAGWRFVWSQWQFRVWGCSPTCGRRIMPATSFTVETRDGSCIPTLKPPLPLDLFDLVGDQV